MRRNLWALVLAAGVLGAVGSVRADDCCTKGAAKPWEGYNKGVKWSIGLSKEPARWSSLAEKGLEIKAGTSLAKRVNLLSAGAKPDWERGLKPALDLARRENKLVMFFQLVGDLDRGGC